MRAYHVTAFIFVITLHVVTCQVDMFELHDKERGDVTMHVTRDSAQIEAIADSVSLVMNPQGGGGGGGGFGFGRSLNNSTTNNLDIKRENNSGGGYTIGNIDQPEIEVKQNTKNISSGSSRSEVVSRDSHVEETHNDKPLPPLPQSNKFIHIAQDDYNVKRSQIPATSHHIKHKHGVSKYKRHFRPRPPCNDVTRNKKTLRRSKITDRFDMLGDFNEIIEKSKKKKRAHVKRKRPNGEARVKGKRSSGDTRREGELYNIHDGNQNNRVEKKKVRACVWKPKGAAKQSTVFLRSHNEKDANATKRFLISGKDLPRLPRNDAKDFSRLPDSESATLTRSPDSDDGREAKKSGIKEMKIHNELGGMHIKSDPSQTAVISESGNIEITMVNDVEPSSVKNNAGAKTEIPGLSSNNRYTTGLSRTLVGEEEGAKKDNVIISRPKIRLHLAEDISLKKSHINTNRQKVVDV